MLGAGEIFTLLFVTLGPLKLLGPFAAQTRELEPPALRAVAWRTFALSLAAVLAGGYIGRSLALSWNISVPALLIATGLIFFLVALNLVLAPYEPPHPPPPQLPAQPLAAALQLIFPTVVTPYGISALIALMAATRDSARVGLVLGMVFAVMVLNLIAMLFARAVMKGGFLLVMRLVGAVLGVLQVALSVQFILVALTQLGVVNGS